MNTAWLKVLNMSGTRNNNHKVLLSAPSDKLLRRDPDGQAGGQWWS